MARRSRSSKKRSVLAGSACVPGSGEGYLQWRKAAFAGSDDSAAVPAARRADALVAGNAARAFGRIDNTFSVVDQGTAPNQN